MSFHSFLFISVCISFACHFLFPCHVNCLFTAAAAYLGWGDPLSCDRRGIWGDFFGEFLEFETCGIWSFFLVNFWNSKHVTFGVFLNF